MQFEYNAPQRGELVGFAVLSSFKIRLVFLRAALQNRETPLLCGRRFLLLIPVDGRGARDWIHTGRILKTAQQSGRGGLLSKNALQFDCVVYEIMHPKNSLICLSGSSSLFRAKSGASLPEAFKGINHAYSLLCCLIFRKPFCFKDGREKAHSALRRLKITLTTGGNLLEGCGTLSLVRWSYPRFTRNCVYYNRIIS